MRKNLRVNWMSLLLVSQKLKTSKLFSKENIDSDNKEITAHYKEQVNSRRRSGRTIARRQRCGYPSSIYFKFWYSG